MGGDIFANVIQHCQKEAASACGGIEDEGVVIGESIWFVQW